MSKKHKKFNKNVILNQLNKKEETHQATSSHTTVDDKKPEIKAEYIDTKIAKQDLKKTAIIVGSLVILLLVIYYLSLKTSIVANFSNNLAIWLHIK